MINLVVLFFLFLFRSVFTCFIMAEGLSGERESGLQKFVAVLEFLLETVVGLLMTVVDLVTRRRKDVSGLVVVITGAAQGIGAEMAELFAAKGAKVALLDKNQVRPSRTVMLHV